MNGFAKVNICIHYPLKHHAEGDLIRQIFRSKKKKEWIATFLCFWKCITMEVPHDLFTSVCCVGKLACGVSLAKWCVKRVVIVVTQNYSMICKWQLEISSGASSHISRGRGKKSCDRRDNFNLAEDECSGRSGDHRDSSGFVRLCGCVWQSEQVNNQFFTFRKSPEIAAGLL